MARPIFYTDRAIAAWEEWANTLDQCPGGTHYYRLFARSDATSTTKAQRGTPGRFACCSECEACGCWCNSSYITTPLHSDERQDASFASELVSGVPTYSDMHVDFSGIVYCDNEHNPAATCPPWMEDNFDALGLNSEHDIPWLGQFDILCTWEETFDLGEIDGCDVTKKITVVVAVSDGGAYSAGDFAVSIILTMSEPAGGPPDECDCGGGVIVFASEKKRPYCSDKSVSLDNVATCALASRVQGDGSVVVTWDTESLVTPDYYTAKFSGNILACVDTSGYPAAVCPLDNVVRAAIVALKDVSGIVLFTGGACSYGSPHFQVRGYPGWYWVVTLSLSDAGGGDTQWDLSAYIQNLSHAHDEGNVGGVSGLRYNCLADRDIHHIYTATADQAEEDCGNPPALPNGLDCTGAHTCVDPSGYDNCTPCADGGSVSLTAGSV